MTPKDVDHPNVAVFPPIVPAGALALAIALQWLVPLHFLGGVDETWRIVIGVAIFYLGLALSLMAHRTLIRHSTNINPFRPTTALVTKGIFNWTRNPIYVGGRALMIGLALVFSLDWLLLLVLPSVMVIHYGVVKREEEYLTRKFAEEYRRYTTRVPRYLWF
ncbi:MAG TPA: isoprenylcysteine carboxylmethyltransferase family protein [Pseudolabrys sp.]